MPDLNYLLHHLPEAVKNATKEPDLNRRRELLEDAARVLEDCRLTLVEYHNERYQKTNESFNWLADNLTKIFPTLPK